MSRFTYEKVIEDIKIADTGEELGHEVTAEIRQISNKRASNEPDYIKLYKYVNTLFAFKGINTRLTPFIIEISNHMTYAKDGQIVNLNRVTKTTIAENLNVTTKRIDQVIAELRKCDILRKIQNGVYSVNPYIVARGSWADIRKLQMHFDYKTGEMTTIANMTDKITGQEVRKAITNSTRQIKGQLSLFDNEALGD